MYSIYNSGHSVKMSKENLTFLLNDVMQKIQNSKDDVELAEAWQTLEFLIKPTIFTCANEFLEDVEANHDLLSHASFFLGTLSQRTWNIRFYANNDMTWIILSSQ